MNNDKYITLDQLIKKSLTQTVKEPDIDLDESWQRFNQKFYPNKKTGYPKLLVAACLLFIIVLTSVFSMPHEGMALNLKFLKIIKSFITGKQQITHMSYSSPKDNPGVDDTSLPPEINTLFKEKGVDGEVVLPVEIISDYKIEKIEVEPKSPSQKITILFRKQDNAGIIMTQEKVPDSFQYAQANDIDDSTARIININGREASLVLYKNGFSSLTWMDGDIFITLTGQLSEEDIIKLACSSRRVAIR